MLTADVTFEPGDYDQIISLGFAGDVNIDGYSDLLIEGRVVAMLSTSTVVMVYGSPTAPTNMDISRMNPEQGFTIFAPVAYGRTQPLMFASDLGDLNSDGYDDYGFGFHPEVFIVSGWQFEITAASDWELYD